MIPLVVNITILLLTSFCLNHKRWWAWLITPWSFVTVVFAVRMLISNFGHGWTFVVAIILTGIAATMFITGIVDIRDDESGESPNDDSIRFLADDVTPWDHTSSGGAKRLYSFQAKSLKEKL